MLGAQRLVRSGCQQFSTDVEADVTPVRLLVESPDFGLGECKQLRIIHRGLGICFITFSSFGLHSPSLPAHMNAKHSLQSSAPAMCITETCSLERPCCSRSRADQLMPLRKAGQGTGELLLGGGVSQGGRRRVNAGIWWPGGWSHGGSDRAVAR